MNNVKRIIDHAEQHCKDHGARLTTKRKQVLSGLLKFEKALSAYELVDYCKDEFGKAIPAMSVYKILEFLPEEHLVHKLNLANKLRWSTFRGNGKLTTDKEEIRKLKA